jgi:uncharacterized protein YpmB
MAPLLPFMRGNRVSSWNNVHLCTLIIIIIVIIVIIIIIVVVIIIIIIIIAPTSPSEALSRQQSALATLSGSATSSCFDTARTVKHCEWRDTARNDQGIWGQVWSVMVHF